MMSMSRRRGDISTKLHMDRQPTIARITDPSLPAGKRREIDNVMKKARANTNDYWDKKLIEVEEKDPNRWRHTGYKKMYIQGESSSGESDREMGYRYNTSSNAGPPPPQLQPPPPQSAPGRYGRSRSPRSRSRSRLRKSPPLVPQRRRSPPLPQRGMSPGMDGGPRGRPRSPRGIPPPRSPIEMGRRPPPYGVRPRSPPDAFLRRKMSRSPIGRRRSPPPPLSASHNVGGIPPRRRSPPPPSSTSMPPNKRGPILPRSKRPPSPPPPQPSRALKQRSCRSRSNSSVSTCSDDSCSVCSPPPPPAHRHRSRSNSLPRGRHHVRPKSPPPPSKPHAASYHHRGSPPPVQAAESHGLLRGHGAPEKFREGKAHRGARERTVEVASSDGGEPHTKMSKRAARAAPADGARLKTRPPEPPEPPAASGASSAKKKKRDKDKETRARIKVEGEKRKKHKSSSESDDSGSDSENSLPTFTATTRLTLSERFGKMAQWSMDRSNMENMRITKDSTGGALKVMIEEGLESPPRRYSYSPAPVGHFPEELATTAPSGMLSWDDVRVRYEYYKSRGYLRDLDLKDYVKWEEWWYKYQEWLKQERYYEYWERQQLQRRRRKKLPITQRLN